MITRTWRQDTIKQNGVTYYPDSNLSCRVMLKEIPFWKVREQLKTKGIKCIQVGVLSRNLRGKTDLYGKLYEPNIFIYTNQPKATA